MNRDTIEEGKTYGKFAEAFLLTGGIGAILYPLVFYYVSYTMVDKRDEFLACIASSEVTAASKGEEHTDGVRTAIFYNLSMICLYLALHFALFQRPEDYRIFKAIGVAYAIIVCIEIVVALILFIHSRNFRTIQSRTGNDELSGGDVEDTDTVHSGTK